MSVLDVFSIIFESEGADKVNSDTKAIEKNMDDLGTKVIGITAAFVGFGSILKKTFDFANKGEDLFLLAKGAGVGVEQVERLGIAMENYGGSASSASATLKKLNTEIQNIRFGKGGALQEGAILYGLDLSAGNAEDMLRNIARRFEGLGTRQQIDLGQRLGLDEPTILLLQGGLENLNKELERGTRLSVFDKEDIENSRKFQMQLREFNQLLDKVWGIIARSILPYLNAFFKGLSYIFDLMSRHKGFVLGFLGAVSAALLAIAIKVGLISLPIILVTALFAGAAAVIGLWIDDIYTFCNGGQAAFSGFYEWVVKLWDKIKDIGGGIRDFFGFGNSDVIVKGKTLVNQTNTPLASMTTNQMSMINKNTQAPINFGGITINTQATDSSEIASGFEQQMTERLRGVGYQFAGGEV